MWIHIWPDSNACRNSTNTYSIVKCFSLWLNQLFSWKRQAWFFFFLLTCIHYCRTLHLKAVWSDCAHSKHHQVSIYLFLPYSDYTNVWIWAIVSISDFFMNLCSVLKPVRGWDFFKSWQKRFWRVSGDCKEWCALYSELQWFSADSAVLTTIAGLNKSRCYRFIGQFPVWRTNFWESTVFLGRISFMLYVLEKMETYAVCVCRNFD